MMVHFNIQILLHHFGYIGVSVILFLENIGIPFPAETTLTISGFEWTQGVFKFLPLLFAAGFGNIIGSTIAYGIGYYLGRPVIVRFGRYIGITEERLDAADEKFAKFRSAIVLFGKFIAGIRVLIPYLAGINRMPFALFSLYNTVSAFVWAAAFITLGRYVGVEWSKYHRVLHHYIVPGIVVLVVIIGVIVAIKLRHRKTHG